MCAYKSEGQRNANRATRKYSEGINSRADWSREKRKLEPDRDKFQLTIKRFETTLTCRTCKQFLTFVGEEFNRMEHEKAIQKFKENHHSHENG